VSDTSLLGVVQTVCREIGIPAPATCVGSVPQQVTQMVAFANMVGDALRDEADWPVLRKVATLTMISGTSGYQVVGVDGSTSLPCSRIVQQTGWDTTNSWYFAGAINDQQWSAWQYGIGTTPVRRLWRTTADDAVEVFPTPSASGDTLVLSFITTHWAKTSAQVFKGTLSADDDYHLFPDRLFISGVKWRFLEAKGLPFGAVFAEYNRLLDVRKAASRPAQTLSMSGGRRGVHLVDYRNVPNTGYGP